MHPKNPEELNVSDDELREVERTIKWFTLCFVNALKNAEDAEAQKIRTIKNHIA